MKHAGLSLLAALILTGCAAETAYDPLEDYDEVEATSVFDAPSPVAARLGRRNREAAAHGEYLVELLGCAACHTDGVLAGEPRIGRPLAGSRIGIAYTNPLEFDYPGVVYPPNITPDDETGIGRWSDERIAAAVQAGAGRHGGRRIVVMPWQSYARLSNEDVEAIVAYLRSIEPVRHRIPDEVPPGTKATEPFIHVGIYRSRQ